LKENQKWQTGSLANYAKIGIYVLCMIKGIYIQDHFNRVIYSKGISIFDHKEVLPQNFEYCQSMVPKTQRVSQQYANAFIKYRIL